MPITTERIDAGIFGLVIDDPEAKNALTEICVDELIKALRALRREPGLRVLIVRGRPEVFCSGATRERLQRAVAGEGDLTAEGYRLFVDELQGFPLPVVGALQGHAVGGGLMLALLLCDMMVAAERSRYGLNFSGLGLSPGMGATAVVPRLVGPVLAAEMLLGGKLFTGGELRDRGLFNYVVPAGEVWEVSLDLARRVAEKPRYVLAMTKELLVSGRRPDLQGAVVRESASQQTCLAEAETAALIETAYLS